MMESHQTKGRCFLWAFAGGLPFTWPAKKGKAILLFLIFFLVSTLLLICFSILNGTGQAARDLCSNIDAAFYIRPYAQMTLEDGALSEGTTPVISQQSIDEVIDASSGQVKAYNTEHYGYAKSEQLHFLSGVDDNEASNMGQITVVRDSHLTDGELYPGYREQHYWLLCM